MFVFQKSNGRSGVRTQDRPVTHQFCGKPHPWLRTPSALSRLSWKNKFSFYQQSLRMCLFSKKVMDALGFEPRTDRLLISSAASRIPDFARLRRWAGWVENDKFSFYRQSFATYLLYKKGNGRSGARTQDRPVMSRLLWPTELSVQSYLSKL